MNINEKHFIGQKRIKPFNLNELNNIKNEKDESTQKICSKCMSEINVITITSIEDALIFLKENDKIKDDNKKIEQSLIPYKLLQKIEICKKCLLDKCTPPNEIKHYFKMLQIIKIEKSNPMFLKELKPNNEIQVSLKLNSNQSSSQENMPKTNSSPISSFLYKQNNANLNDQEKETQTIKPNFTSVLQLQNKSETISSNNIELLITQDNQQKFNIPINIQPQLNHQQTQQSNCKNSEINNNLFSHINPMSQYQDYHPPHQSLDKRKATDPAIQERNLELINQALDELKAQIGTMKYCNHLQKNSLSSLINYMEFFNEQFKTHSFYQNSSNNYFSIPQQLLFTNNNQQNMMDFFPKQIPRNIPIGLNPESMPSLFHNKIPNSSFQNQNQRGAANK